MEAVEINAFARAELEAIPDRFIGSTYRCAAYLSDGVYLPCVHLLNREKAADEAARRILERIEDGQKPPDQQRFGSGMTFPNLIKSYRTAGNRVDEHYIARLEPSPHVISNELLRLIDGETSMAGTRFVAVMRDGREFPFAIPGYLDFFEMPRGYTGKDVVSLRPHQTLPKKLYRDKPHFDCFVSGLE